MEWAGQESDEIAFPEFTFDVDGDGDLVLKFSEDTVVSLACGEEVSDGVELEKVEVHSAEMDKEQQKVQEDVSSLSALLASWSAEALPLQLFDESVPAFACPVAAVPVTRPTHSRKRKHEREEGASASYVPRTKRARSTFSYKFASVQDEVNYRLYTEDGVKKSQKLNALVRTCYQRFQDSWMTWDDVKAVATEVGYSKTNNLFRCIWPLVVSRYGRQSETVQNCEVFGINFPYWIMDTSVQYKRGELGKTRLRLAPEFFIGPVSI